jgi:hypothetical protein
VWAGASSTTFISMSLVRTEQGSPIVQCLAGSAADLSSARADKHVVRTRPGPGYGSLSSAGSHSPADDSFA